MKPTNYCGARPSPARRCNPDCVCTLPAGHTTKHRAACGLRWSERAGKKRPCVANRIARELGWGVAVGESENVTVRR